MVNLDQETTESKDEVMQFSLFGIFKSSLSMNCYVCHLYVRPSCFLSIVWLHINTTNKHNIVILYRLFEKILKQILNLCCKKLVLVHWAHSPESKFAS